MEPGRSTLWTVDAGDGHQAVPMLPHGGFPAAALIFFWGGVEHFDLQMLLWWDLNCILLVRKDGELTVIETVWRTKQDMSRADECILDSRAGHLFLGECSGPTNLQSRSCRWAASDPIEGWPRLLQSWGDQTKFGSTANAVLRVPQDELERPASAKGGFYSAPKGWRGNMFFWPVWNRGFSGLGGNLIKRSTSWSLLYSGVFTGQASIFFPQPRTQRWREHSKVDCEMLWEPYQLDISWDSSPMADSLGPRWVPVGFGPSAF